MTSPNPPFGGWRKSSHSDSGTHGDCVEVTAAGRKSVLGSLGTASADRTIALRDSKNPDGPILSFTPAEWSALIRHIKHLDQPRLTYRC